MLKSTWKDEFSSEVLADIGVYPLSDDSEDAENHSNSSFNDALYKYVLLEPTPPTAISLCTDPSLFTQQNPETPILSSNFNYNKRKRPRLDPPTSQDFFESLSDEIVLHIFQWLSKSTLKHCAGVCKRWRYLSYDETLWKSINLGSKNLNPGILGHVLQRGVIVLRLAKANVESPVFLSDVCDLNITIRLQYLDLSMATISTTNLEELFLVCRLLQKVSLENCKINNNICNYLVKNQNLDELNLTLCSGIETDGLKVLLHGCQKLATLSLAWTNLSKEAIDYAVCNFPKSVTQLNLSGCRHTLNDANVKSLVEQCNALLELDLSDANELSGCCVDYIVCLQSLKKLALSRCYHIKPNCYWHLAAISSLVHLEIFGIFSKTGLAVVQEKFAQLEINKEPFSTIARPTTGIRRTSIWSHKVR